MGFQFFSKVKVFERFKVFDERLYVYCDFPEHVMFTFATFTLLGAFEQINGGISDRNEQVKRVCRNGECFISDVSKLNFLFFVRS